MKVLLFTLLLSFSSFAHELPYANYLKMQDSLAKDNYSEALKTWKLICEKELGHYAKDAKYNDCQKQFKDIKELRESFKALSEIYIKNGEAIKDKSIVVAKCPMAKARWLQKKGDVANPYYGKEMLQCGSIE